MSTAEMVIKLVDGSENQPSPNLLPDGSQHVPTVDSVRPKQPFPAPTPSQAPEAKETDTEVVQNYPNYLTNTVFIDSMDEFTRRIENAIQLARAKRNPPPENNNTPPQTVPDKSNSDVSAALSSAVDALRRFSPKWLDGVLDDLQKSLASSTPKQEPTKSREPEPSQSPPTNSIPTVASVSDAITQASEVIAERVDETNRHLQTIIDRINKTTDGPTGTSPPPPPPPAPEHASTPSPSTSQPQADRGNFASRFAKRLSSRLGNTRVGRMGQAVYRKAAPRAKAISTRLRKLSRRSGKVSRASSTAVRKSAGQFLARAGARAAGKAGVGAAGAGVGAGATGAAAGSAAAAGGASAGTVLAVGAAIALPVAALAALTAAAYGTKQAFDAAADTIEKFSPGVNYQRARSRANTEINMLERSRVIGGTSTQIELAKTHLQDSTERLWTRMLSLLETFAPLITKGTDSLSLLVDMASAVLASLDVVKATLTVTDWQDDGPAKKSLSQAKERVKVSWEKLFSGTQRKATPPTFDEMFERFRRSVENDKR